MFDGNMMETTLVKLNTIAGLDRFLESSGIDFSVIESEFNFDRNLFFDANAMISLATVSAILLRCAELLNSNAFGIDFTEKQIFASSGTLRLLFETSSSLEAGFRTQIRYQKLQNPNAYFSILRHSETGETALHFNPGPITGLLRRIIIDIGLSRAWQFSDGRFKSGLKLKRVEFRRTKDPEVARYRDFFRAPIQYDAEADCLVFHSSDFEANLKESNPVINHFVQRHFESKSHDKPIDFTQQIKKIIRMLISTGACRIEDVASLYACEKRTLQRHLKKINLSYQMLLNEVRFEMATEYLSHSDKPLSQIALMSGFSDASNFARTFKQHFSMTPMAWRATQGNRSSNRIEQQKKILEATLPIKD